MAKRALRKRNLSDTFSNDAAINKAVISAVKKAVDMHRRAGNKIAVLRNGKVVKIDPRKVLAS